ncbi:hypothetical protein CCMSSC00406_0008085 [Pleurotus cornucopiae]|uniref:Uncharacterized protein n=1 Tax=Pleurotus cornucopiae TaxID=5321 RepID=A0ACB7IJW1_PLECO|nr:hypothetical protein CCMSSC00406_0008085 [Pleurotus cornucopiae]
MIGDFPGGQGCLEGPVSPHNYKRAVYRQAPLKFTVEMLGPQKQGGNYSFGMLIRPLHDRSSLNSARRSMAAYEVWRRWEDCLWLQETIEMEYERLARQKRQRLVKGKGVKKNGIYLQGEAASFESLPPGPDPKSIAQNIHDTIPRLSKRGTLFRASMALVEQRHRELTSLIEGLFRDDVPSLIQELRESRIVTDFFGYWRRDFDLAQKTPRRDSTLPRTSFSSAYSTESEQSTRGPKRPVSVITVTRPPPPIRVFSAPATQSAHILSDEDLPRSSISSSSSSPSSRDSQSSLATSSPTHVVADDHAVIANHSGKLAPDYIFPHNRGLIALESLPEDAVLPTKLDSNEPSPIPPARRLQRSGSLNGEYPRTSPHVSSRRLASRDSCMSGMSMLDGLGVVLPESPVFANHRQRDSISSVLTTRSSDAIIPMSLSNRRRSLSAASPNDIPYRSLSDDEPYSDRDDDDDIDPHFYDAFPMPNPPPLPSRGSQSRFHTSRQHSRRMESNGTPSSPNLSLPSPSSPITPALSPISMSPNLSGPSMFAKAAYQSVIVLLRLACDITFCSVRSKLKEKFSSQGVELEDSFALYLVLPLPVPEDGGLLTPGVLSGKPRQRTSTLSMSLTDSSRLKVIRCQADWDRVVAPSDGARLTLRVLDEEIND